MRKRRSSHPYLLLILLAICVIAAEAFNIAHSVLDHHTPNPKATNPTAALPTSGSWLPNDHNLAARVAKLGMPPFQDPGPQHYHWHLRISINGRNVPVAAQIGFPSWATQASQVSPVHTHDTTGIIHVESTSPLFRCSVGDLFAIWGVKITATHLGPYPNLHIWVNGKPVTGDPMKISLQRHDAVTVAAGRIPAGFQPDRAFRFPAGL